MDVSWSLREEGRRFEQTSALEETTKMVDFTKGFIALVVRIKASCGRSIGETHAGREKGRVLTSPLLGVGDWDNIHRLRAFFRLRVLDYVLADPQCNQHRVHDVLRLGMLSNSMPILSKDQDVP